MARGQILGYICDAAFKGDLASGRLASYDVCLCADDVEDYVGREVAPEFSEPDAHFFKGGEVSYAVAEDAGVCTAIVEARYRTVLNNHVRMCIKDST